MARRRGRMRRNPRQGPGHNESNKQTRESRSRDRMLDAGREAHFRYDVEEILTIAGMEPEDLRPFLQMLWTKGSRNNIDEAQDWLKEQVDLGRVADDDAKSIKRLIKKYSTVR